MRNYLILLSLFIGPLLKAQLVTSNTLTPTQLVNQVLLGAGVTATNITFTGDAAQIARFRTAAVDSLRMRSGIMLSSGNALTSSPDGPQGPNGSPSQTTDFSNPGDPNLDALIAPIQSFDAAFLEFDFVPQADTVRFRYIFGSEEYNEFVNGTVNDVFGFFLTGPNPSGGAYTNKNIALVPSTTVAISINDVNNGLKPNNITTGMPVQSTGPCEYCQYYRDNWNGAANVQYDGLTTVLTAIAGVSCGQTYHIKIAIGDGGDGAFDSGVFLEEGSFSSAPPIAVSSSNSNAAFADTVMFEGCNTNCLYLVRTGNIALKDSFKLVVSGNAVNGSDYQKNGVAYPWPSNLLYNANQDTIFLCDIKAVEDNVAEGTDTITFTISTYTSSSTSCVASNTIKFNLYIKDYLKVNIGQGDEITCNGQAINLNANASQGVPAYTYTWQPGNAHTSGINTGPVNNPTTYTVTVKDICNERLPESKVITVTPSTLPVLSDIGPYTFCVDTVRNIALNITGGKPAFDIHWLIPPGGIAPSDTNGYVYTFLSSDLPSGGTYTVTLNDQCNKKDTIQVDITIVDCNIIVPNVVTANGDNTNDVFRIHGLENFPGSSLAVFNRWGRKVYSQDNYQNNWKPNQNAGSYFYVLELTDGRKFNGFFELFTN